MKVIVLSATGVGYAKPTVVTYARIGQEVVARVESGSGMKRNAATFDHLPFLASRVLLAAR
jgi:hypothetical protein